MAKTCRRLPPELLVEIHKCLPLANAIYVLVNISKTFFLNNSARMRRIKMSLNEYIDELVNNGEQNNGNELRIENNNVEWKAQLNALLRYGGWMTSIQKLFIGQKDLSCIRRIGRSIVGHPENFLAELIMYMANSRSPQLVLQSVEMNLERASLPTFLKPLLNEKNYQWIVPGRYLRDKSFELKAEDGQTLSIFDAELRQYYSEKYELRIILVNKKDRKYWFEMSMAVDSAKKFIRRLEFTKWKMEPLDENGQFELSWLNEYQIEENGCKLEARQSIDWNSMWDLVMRRGSAFTEYRHFTAKQEFDFSYYYCDDYSAFWINYISETKHPEELLGTIDIKMGLFLMSFFIDKIWKICHKGIPEGGNVFKVEGKKLHILSAKTAKAKCRKGKIIQERELELTLANIPTNGQYEFDIAFQFQYARPDRIIGIKIKKRKIGKKRMRALIDDEDEYGPTCSSKIMKK